MDERTYSKFERGENKSMDIRLLASIASLLEIDLPILLQDAEEQEAKEQELHVNGEHPSAIDIEKEIRTLKEEVHELILYHKETLKLLKTYSE
jgi:transcriptional regulator with XRE-family HTH domain